MTANRMLVIGRRFCGPPASGNGGYTAGMLAAAAAKPVEVRLMQPPPLDTPLEILDDPETSGLLLKNGEEMIASCEGQDLRARGAEAAVLRARTCGGEQVRGIPRPQLPRLFRLRTGPGARRRHAHLRVAHRRDGSLRGGLAAESYACRCGRQGAAGVHVGSARLSRLLCNRRLRHAVRCSASTRPASIAASTSTRPASSSAGRSATTAASTTRARRSSMVSANSAAARSRPGSSRGNS